MLTNDIRQRIIDSYLNGFAKKEIAAVLNIKLGTVYSVIKIFLQEGRVNAKLKGGVRNKKLNEEQILYLQSCIDEDAGITLKKLKQNLLEKFDTEISTTSIDNYIQDFNYSFKKITLMPVRRNTLDALEVRAVYVQRFLELLSLYDDSNIIFVDEVGFNVTMRTKFGRSKRGTRAIHVVAGLRSRNISVCCSMTKNSIINYQIQATAFNTSTFLTYIDSLIDSIRNKGPCVIIMDNVPFHKANQIKDLINENNHVLLFLPPYSPFLNPIENMFAKWKQNIRQSKPTCEEDLLNQINNVNNLITSNDCSAYFRHMMGFIPRCMNKEEIINE